MHTSVVMVFGTFDVVHEGHRDLFRQAKKLGDRLIVVVARDASVRLIKGMEPDHGENDRLAAVQAETDVDEAVLGALANKHAVIIQYRPAVIALGYDQRSFEGGLEETLMEHGLSETRIVRLKPYQPEIYKSSLMKRHGQR